MGQQLPAEHDAAPHDGQHERLCFGEPARDVARHPLDGRRDGLRPTHELGPVQDAPGLLARDLHQPALPRTSPVAKAENS
jgi:hypothetical protein